MEIKKEIKKESYAVRLSIGEGEEEKGRAYLYVLFNESRPEPYGLFDVLVNEDARGKGLGTQLVKALIAEAKERGCYKLIGTSRYTRPKVHAWYESLGFQDYGKEFRMDL